MTQLTTASRDPVRPFSFGTMQFGGKADEADSAAMFNACLEAGITHFDTAWVYTDGRSEEILGKLIGTRDDLYIATKVGYVGGGSRANIMEQFDESRRRLGRDSVDLLYLHVFDAETDLSETIDAFAHLQHQGLIRQIGVSNFAAWQVMKAQAIAARFETRIDVVQPMYNLVKRQAEVEILPMCADQGIAVCTYSPLGGGLLTGKYVAGDSGRLKEDARYAARYGQAVMQDAAAGLVQLAEREGCAPATLAVAWAAANPLGVVQPILSARTAEQLAPSLDGMRYKLSAPLYEEMCALMPAPPPATDRIEEA